MGHMWITFNQITRIALHFSSETQGKIRCDDGGQ